MDDDDFSLPERISTQLTVSNWEIICPLIFPFQRVGKGVYHKSNVVFVALDGITNIIGQKLGAYYPTMMVDRCFAKLWKTFLLKILKECCTASEVETRELVRRSSLLSRFATERSVEE